MSIKTMIQKWLGIEPQKPPVSDSCVYQAPMSCTHQENMQPLPFNKNQKTTEAKFRRYGKAPDDLQDFYNACGGYQVFSKIMRHKNWYTVNQRRNDENYPFVLIVFDNDSVSTNGNPESRSFRVKSYEDGHKAAKRLIDIHIQEIRKRDIH